MSQAAFFLRAAIHALAGRSDDCSDGPPEAIKLSCVVVCVSLNPGNFAGIRHMHPGIKQLAALGRSIHDLQRHVAGASRRARETLLRLADTYFSDGLRGAPKDMRVQCAPLGADGQWRKIVSQMEACVSEQQLAGELHAKAERMMGAIDYELMRLADDLGYLMPQQVLVHLEPQVVTPRPVRPVAVASLAA